jgi:quinol monooxygenase YgiN
MEPVVIIPECVIDAERLKEFLAELKRFAALVRENRDCLAYDIVQSVENPRHILIIEVWTSEEAVDRHIASPELADFHARMHQTYSVPFTARMMKVIREGGLLE